MKAVVKRLTDRAFTILDVFAVVFAVQLTVTWPYWAQILIVVGAVILANLTADLLREAARLSTRKRVKS